MYIYSVIGDNIINNLIKFYLPLWLYFFNETLSNTMGMVNQKKNSYIEIIKKNKININNL